MAALDFPNTPVVGDLYGSAGTVWRWDGARWATTSGAGAPPAPVVVVSNTTFSTNVVYGTPAAISPNLNTPTITPRSTNSKFLVRVSLMIGQTGADDAAFFLLRNGVQIGNGSGGTTNCARYHRFAAAAQSNLEMAHISWEYLDSPATVSTLNYCPAMGVRVAGGSQTLYLNRRGDGTSFVGTSSISVQEIP